MKVELCNDGPFTIILDENTLHKKNGTAGELSPAVFYSTSQNFQDSFVKNLENVFIKYRNRKKKKNITKKRKILLLETGKNKYIFLNSHEKILVILLVDK